MHDRSRSFAPVFGKVAATTHSGGDPHSESLDAFVKGRLEFGKDVIHIVMFSRGDEPGRQLPDAIIEATGIC
jgi:hypothetical protein